MHASFSLTPSPLTSPILCGVEGWASPKEPNPHPRHPLDTLSRRISLVEIDTCFDRFLRPELVALWTSKVKHHPDFQFTAKLHRHFIENRLFEKSEIAAFHDSMKPLADNGRLAAVVFSFPTAFRFTTENRAHLIQLRRTFHHYPLVAELPHASWTSLEARGALIDHHVGYANLDQPQAVYAAPPTAFLTWRLAYFKLKGHAAGANPNAYLYPVNELEEWRRRIGRVAQFAERTLVVFGNTPAGRATINAVQMDGLLDSVRYSNAPTLASTYALSSAGSSASPDRKGSGTRARTAA